jgi:flagellar FliL protein
MAEEKQEENVDETGGSKKKIIMIAGGVVLLLVIAGAGLFFTGFFDEEAPVESADPTKEASTEEGGDAGETEEVAAEGAEVIYQALKPPFTVNFSKGSIKVMKVSITLMATDEKAIEGLKLHNPVIRNNILLLLSTQDPEKLKPAEGKAQLQKELKDEINKVLKRRKVSSNVKEVFFTDLVMQ